MRQELGPNQQAWLAALRSGKYKQTEMRLRDTKGFCCLGVGCDVFDGLGWDRDSDNGVYTFEGEDDALPDCVVHHLGLHDGNGNPVGFGCEYQPSCDNMNDILELTFEQIAERLERYAHLYFEEPR